MAVGLFPYNPTVLHYNYWKDMKPKIILDPYGRWMANIFSTEDLERVLSALDVIWAVGESMPETEIGELL